MKKTWFLNVLCLALAILGISLEQVAVPNQEIVIKFTDATVSDAETQDAISRVKGTLEGLEANNIHIQEAGNGILKVRYYSTVDVIDIERAFASETELQLATQKKKRDDSNEPSHSERDGYELGIYKIQQQIDFPDLNGNVLESNPEAVRFIAFDGTAAILKIETKFVAVQERTAYTAQKHIALAIYEVSYNIPEVRAGPTV